MKYHPLNKDLLQVGIEVWRNALKWQHSDGSMPAGHNGPHHDAETPIRNTSHYLIAFKFAWQKTGDSAFKNAAMKCLDYLLAENSPYYAGHTYKHRQASNKDMCNGIIGPAWNIEALLAASSLPREDEARERGKKLFLLHPLNDALRLWKRVEWDGRSLGEDPTLNHQLWFAACAAPLISDTPEAKQRVEYFVEGLNNNWALSRNGRIIHPAWTPKRRWRERVKRIIRPDYRTNMMIKEVGYHAFNLYALAMLHENGIKFSAKVHKKIVQTIKYLNHPQFIQEIETSPFGFPYNPPGWEIPYVNHVFRDIYTPKRSASEWIHRQLLHSLDVNTWQLSRGTPDAATATARMYECVRWPVDLLQTRCQLEQM